MRNDLLWIHFTFGHQSLTLNPSVKDAATMNSVERQTFENNIIEKVVNVKRLAM